MKLNRKRKDARFPNWVLELLATLQIKYQWSFTEALIRCTEKGAAYYNKQWQKMHPSEKASEEAQDGERCPNDRQDDYKEKEPKKEEDPKEAWERINKKLEDKFPWMKTDEDTKETLNKYRLEHQWRDPSSKEEWENYQKEQIDKMLDEIYRKDKKK